MEDIVLRISFGIYIGIAFFGCILAKARYDDLIGYGVIRESIYRRFLYAITVLQVVLVVLLLITTFMHFGIVVRKDTPIMAVFLFLMMPVELIFNVASMHFYCDAGGSILTPMITCSIATALNLTTVIIALI